MKCVHCGEDIPDNAAFCPFCGAPVSSDTSGTGTPRSQPAQQSGGRVTYSEGCLRAAWRDIRSYLTTGKLLLLGLLQCIPIVDFFADGYVFNWSSEVPYGGRTPLPRRILAVHNFEIGFFIFLITLVFGVIVSVATAIFELIPLIGYLIAILLYFAYYMFYYLAGLRVSMSRRLGPGFSLGKMGRAMGRNFSEAFCITILPTLIVGIIESIIALIVLFAVLGETWVLLFLGAFVELFTDGISGSLDMMSEWIASIGTGPFVALILLMVLVIYVFAILQTIAEMLSTRATAHFIGRYVQEWTGEFPEARDLPTSDPDVR